MIKAFNEAAKDILNGLPKIIESYEINAPKLDSFDDEISRVFKNVRLTFARKYTPIEAQMLAENYADKTIKWNYTQIKNQFIKVLGLSPVESEPFLKPLRDNFITQNVDLITSIPEEHFTKIERMVRQATASGQLNRNLANDIIGKFSDDIKKVTGNVEARAQLIARDQIAKINSNLNMARQQNLGLNQYVWRTSQDERVRESHKKLSGKIISWDKPPSVGHPGEDYQCRCVAEPYFSSTSVLKNTNLLEELENAN